MTPFKAFGLLGYPVVLFSIFANLLMLTGPLFMLQVYDRVLSSRSEETLVSLFVLVAALYGLMAMLEYARGRVMARVGVRLQNQLDAPLFRARLRVASLDAKTGREAALRDVDAVQSFMASPALLSFIDLPWTPLFIAVIFIFHPMLGWLAVVGGAALVILAVTNQLVTFARARTALGETEVAHNLAQEATLGAEVIRAQAMQDNVERRLLAQRQRALQKTVSASDWTGGFTALTKALRLFLQSAMLALGAYLVLQGQLTAGGMIAASIILGRALAPVEQLLGQWPAIQRARTGWKRIKELLAKVPVEQLPTPLPVPEPLLTVKNLTVVPPGSRSPNLRNVTFQVKPGEALGVIGRSGAGKSSLARALLGLWQPAAGEIRLGPASLDQYSNNDLGTHIGYLPQDVTLFQGTITENIARMAPEPDNASVVASAQKANAHELITGMENGYDTMIAGQDNHLSGGQRQRIALARVFYGEPQLVILDEPNSALDAEGSAALNKAVRELKANGKAIIIMTHRPMAISECDNLLILDKGATTAYGPRDEVLQSMVKNADQVAHVLKAQSK